MKKKLLLFASMLTLSFAAFAGNACEVQVKFNPTVITDWNQVNCDAKGVYFYDGARFFKAEKDTDLSDDTLVVFSADVEIPATLCVSLGKYETNDELGLYKSASDFYENYPSFRSTDVTVKNYDFVSLIMTGGSYESESESDKWPNVLTIDSKASIKSAVSGIEPLYSKKNLLPENLFNYNNDKTAWHYYWWNNAGTISIANPGYGASEGALMLSTTSKSSDPWGAQALVELPKPLPAGRYIISFFAKADKAGAVIEFGIKDKEAQATVEYYTGSSTLTEDWKSYSYIVESKKETSWMEVNHGHALGNVYVDCLSILASEPENPRLNALTEDQFNFNKGIDGAAKWYYFSWNNGKGTAAAKSSKDGFMGSAGCLELVNGTLCNNAYEAQVFNDVPAIPAGNYTLSFFAKASANNAEMAFGYRDANGNNEQFLPGFTLSTNWQYYSVSFESPIALGRLQINHGKFVGSIFIDCITLTDTEQRYNAANLLKENQFNYNDTSAKCGWSYLGWNNAGTASIVSEGVLGSKGALLLKTTSKSGDPWGAQALHELPEPLPAGTYSVTFLAKADNAGAEIQFGIKDKQYNGSHEKYTKNTQILTENWKWYTDTIKTEEKTAWMEVNHGHALGAVYIDCLELLPVVNEPEEPEEPEEPTDIYYLKNYSTGKYLGWDGEQVVFKADSAKQNFEVALTDTQKGQFTTALTYVNGEEKTPYYLSIGGSFGYNFKTNIDAGEQGHSYWFEVVDTKFGYIEATKAADVEAGKYYIIIQYYQGYAALGGEIINTGDENNLKYRVKGIALPDFKAETDYMMLPTALYNSCVYLLESDVPTLVPTVFEAENNDVIYNTLGQRVNAPVKGINLINGQKILF